jgi:hypothetical protein
VIRRVLALALVGLLAGCGGSTPPPTFAPLDYSYLPPITLRVATVNVVNNYVPTPGAATMLAQDPVQPGSVLTQVLSRRLIANGTPGTATATIDTASIDQNGDNLTGTLTVELNVVSADGLHTGYTTATVTQSDSAPDSNSSQSDVSAALYQLTKELMDAMNVQLQYQVVHNLGSWVVGAGMPAAPGLVPGSAGVPDGIQASPLTTPPGAPAPLTSGLPPPAGTPTAVPGGPPMQLVPATPPPLNPATSGPPAAPSPPAAPAAAPAFNPANVGL